MSEEQISAAIETSRVQGWSELKDGVHDDDDDDAAASSHGLDNQVVWEELKKRDPRVFGDEEVKLGRVIVEGCQAHIYETSVNGRHYFEYVAKVFKMEGFLLADLQRQWPLNTKPPIKSQGIGYDFVLSGIVFGEIILACSPIFWGKLLKDGRFAFVMPRCWDDLPTLINLRLSDKNSAGRPLSHFRAGKVMCEIAMGMRQLHRRGVLHRHLLLVVLIQGMMKISFARWRILRVL